MDFEKWFVLKVFFFFAFYNLLNLRQIAFPILTVFCMFYLLTCTFKANEYLACFALERYSKLHTISH